MTSKIPPSLLQALTDPPPPPKPIPSRSGDGLGFQPRSYFNTHGDLHGLMVKHGWQHDHGEYWVRPNKDPRDGHSAQFHADKNLLVVYTTDIPPELERLGKPTRGQHLSVTPYDFLCCYEFGGDTKACDRWIGQQYGPAQPPRLTLVAGITPEEATADGPASPNVPLYLPAEWYEQREWLATCRQMAQASGGSPIAQTLAFMSRWATLIPPGYSIPPINGAPSSFDVMFLIAGTSGSHKTSAMRNAEAMLPVLRNDLRMGLGLGSGEGIVEAFYGWREIPDSKKGARERWRNIAAVNFAISEGVIFADLAERHGANHVTRMCDAWSGATLSTANANHDTFRHVPAGQYRFTMLLGIQALMAGRLITAEAASQGLVGRLVMGWCEEPRSGARGKPPEQLALPVPMEIATPETRESPKTYHPTYLEYPDVIWTECQERHDVRIGTNVPVEEHHHDLCRLKLAGILALMEGRQNVTLDDWGIATDLVDTSAAVRRHLQRLASQQRQVSSVTAAEYRGELKVVEQEAAERRVIAGLSTRLVERTPKDGWTIHQAERALTARKTRHRLRPALDLAVANGYLRVGGERIHRL